MIFTELVLQNFGPYFGRQVINLNPQINPDESRPIILLGAMNGGGKTTLMDAIRLALYGQRAQCSTRNNLSYSDFLIQAINSQATAVDQTRIELAFKQIINHEWREFRIVRYWTKHLKDGKDHLGIIDEYWTDDALSETWDEYIENLLPLGISNLFLFDGEQVKELADLETPPQTVIEAIQSLLGLELVEKLSVDLDVLVSRKRKSLADKNQVADLEEIEAKIKQAKQNLEDLEQKLEFIQEQVEQAKQKYHESLDKFRTEGGKIASNKNEKEIQKQALEYQVNSFRDELRDISADVLPLGLITPLLKQAQQQTKQELKVIQTKATQGVLEDRDHRLLEYIIQLSLTSENIEKIDKFLKQDHQTLQQEIIQYGEPWLGLEEEGLKQLETILSHRLPSQISLSQEKINQIQKIETEIDNIDRQLAAAASPEEYDRLDNIVKETQKEYYNLQEQLVTVTRLQQEAQKRFEQAKKELSTYGTEYLDKQNNEHLIQSAEKVQQTLAIFKERLTLKKLNKLEGEVTECFRYLLHKSNLVHRVAINTLNFSLSLFDPEGQPVPKHRLSAGEKQLLAISFLWGLARVTGRNLPIAIDTPLGRLDSSHRNNLVERYFPTASHQVILLSTDTEIGENEVKQLNSTEAIARQYLLEYNPQKRQTIVHPDRYFW
ncbi:DNA sulfur modification protein DndD [Aphanothece hegewaldii CCALA 016]|uniref:Nuclease SbcCD subunit C n=1 Tax=Aphanothece hegewaldii CCALA 016 TaxID=2107694 RepID=A0A2T1LV30_9CHRO|nr:DNA sulfur modification protein DndD [Aphanothece hegewaldii]PSF35542.1 DNA sulfur modification protein DndD [Aphanothece hegewaldii CCALA 016]